MDKDLNKEELTKEELTENILKEAENRVDESDFMLKVGDYVVVDGVDIKLQSVKNMVLFEREARDLIKYNYPDIYKEYELLSYFRNDKEFTENREDFYLKCIEYGIDSKVLSHYAQIYDQYLSCILIRECFVGFSDMGLDAIYDKFMRDTENFHYFLDLVYKANGASKQKEVETFRSEE